MNTMITAARQLYDGLGGLLHVRWWADRAACSRRCVVERIGLRDWVQVFKRRDQRAELADVDGAHAALPVEAAMVAPSQP